MIFSGGNPFNESQVATRLKNFFFQQIKKIISPLIPGPDRFTAENQSQRDAQIHV